MMEFVGEDEQPGMKQHTIAAKLESKRGLDNERAYIGYFDPWFGSITENSRPSELGAFREYCAVRRWSSSFAAGCFGSSRSELLYRSIASF